MESKLRIVPFDNGLTIKFFGELDSSKTFLYKDRIKKEMSKNNAKFLLFDFKDCTFIDSSGIGLILGRYNEVEARNGGCGLIHLSKYAYKVIRISGLFSIMEEYDSLRDFKKDMEVKCK